MKSKKNLIAEVDSLFPKYTYEYVHSRINKRFLNSKDILEIKNRNQLIKLMVLIYFDGVLKLKRYKGVQMTRVMLLSAPVFGYLSYQFDTDPLSIYSCDVYLTDKGRALVEQAELQVNTRSVMEKAKATPQTPFLCF